MTQNSVTLKSHTGRGKGLTTQFVRISSGQSADFEAKINRRLQDD